MIKTVWVENPANVNESKSNIFLSPGEDLAIPAEGHGELTPTLHSSNLGVELGDQFGGLAAVTTPPAQLAKVSISPRPHCTYEVRQTRLHIMNNRPFSIVRADP